jgi:hypothetical protein
VQEVVPPVLYRCDYHLIIGAPARLSSVDPKWLAEVRSTTNSSVLVSLMTLCFGRDSQPASSAAARKGVSDARCFIATQYLKRA